MAERQKYTREKAELEVHLAALSPRKELEPEQTRFFAVDADNTKVNLRLLRPIKTVKENELLGPKIIEAEMTAPDVAGGPFRRISVESAKWKYFILVGSIVDVMRGEGTGKPTSVKELKSLLKDISSMVWSNWGSYQITDMLFQGVRTGRLDCDTSAMVIGDIATLFGVKGELTLVDHHALLKATLPNGKSVWMETTGILGPITKFFAFDLVFYNSESELKDKYEHIVGNVKLEDVPRLIRSGRIYNGGYNL